MGIRSHEFVAFNHKCGWHGDPVDVQLASEGWGGGSLMGLSRQPVRYVLAPGHSHQNGIELLDTKLVSES